MRNIFFTADTHFGHNAIIKHARRPAETTDEMDALLMDNWNTTVHSGDTIYILGDFAWRNHDQWIHRLNGKKILIRGNHDRMSKWCLSQFTDVYDLRTININHQSIILCHYRLATWPGKGRGQWHFYGHSHGSLPEDPITQCCDVGTDIWNYSPVEYSILEIKMKQRPGKNPEWQRTPDEIHECRQKLRQENQECRLLGEKYHDDSEQN